MSETKMQWEKSPNGTWDWVTYLRGRVVYVRRVARYWEAQSRRNGESGIGNTREEAANNLLAKETFGT
jgi:hypothetical protein